jgi:hypothetical protein
LAALVGSALHLLSALPNPLLSKIGWGAPLVFTVGYFAYGMRKGWNLRPASREKFADNTYYLGFIFTQVALIVGFVPMSLFNAELTSQDVLRAFSVALGASLLGLVLRTLLVQTSHSVPKHSDIVQSEVEALARSVSRQTQVILDDFNQLGGKLTETYSSLNAELTDCIGNLAKTFRSYEDAVGKDALALSSAATAMDETTSSARKAVELSASALNAQTADAARALESAKDTLRAELLGAVRALETTTGAMGKGAEALGQLPAFGRTIETLSVRLKATTDAVGGLESLFTDRGRSIDEASQRAVGAWDQSSVQLKNDLAGRASAFQRELDGAVQSLDATLGRFKAELERTRE